MAMFYNRIIGFETTYLVVVVVVMVVVLVVVLVVLVVVVVAVYNLVQACLPMYSWQHI